MKSKRWWPVLALLAVYYALNHFGMAKLSFTYDEVPHMLYGLRVSEGNSDRFDDSKMPVSWLNALPLSLAGFTSEQLRTSREDPTLRITPGRRVTVLAGVALGLVIFSWAAALYGYPGGLLALMLFVLEPNLAAHAQLVTTDLYAALFTTLALFTFWRFLTRGGKGRLTVAAVCLGLAQIAKYSATYLFPLFALIGLLWWWRQPNRRALWRPWLASAGVYVLASVVIINIAFLFNGTLKPWGEYRFESNLFKGIQGQTSALAAVPVPLPYPYVQGLDLVKYREESGVGYGRIYLLGETRTGEGFFAYYLVAFLFKTPLALIGLIGWALVYFWRHRSTFRFADDELLLALPIAFFALYFSFFFQAQIGLRYFLVVYPLLIIFAAGLVKLWPATPTKARWTLAGLVAWMAVSNLSYFGHSLSYFNELVGSRMNAYRILADSNLDWGQNRYYLREYLEANPDTEIAPAAPRPGRFIADVNIATGVTTDRPGGWLRAFEPVDHLVYTYLIYEVTPEALRARIPALRDPGTR